MVFARDKIENELKIQSGDDDLLESILTKWGNGSYIPLFVSGGTTEQKTKSIQSTYYLNTVYREVLTDMSESLAIYGWEFGEHDLHIINRIYLGGARRFAVSVFPDGKEEAYCNRARQIIKDACSNEAVEIEFFVPPVKGAGTMLNKWLLADQWNQTRLIRQFPQVKSKCTHNESCVHVKGIRHL